MVTHLAQLARNPDDTARHNLSLAAQESVVEHLVCTQPSMTSAPSPVLGVSVRRPPIALVCLLSDYTLLDLALSTPHFSAPPPLLSKTERASSSPLRTRPAGESFEDRIKILLRKETTLPLLKSRHADITDSQQALDTITRSTQVQ